MSNIKVKIIIYSIAVCVFILFKLAPTSKEKELRDIALKWLEVSDRGHFSKLRTITNGYKSEKDFDSLIQLIKKNHLEYGKINSRSFNSVISKIEGFGILVTFNSTFKKKNGKEWVRIDEQNNQWIVGGYLLSEKQD